MSDYYCNDCDPDPFYDFKDTDNPVDLIDDIKEEKPLDREPITKKRMREFLYKMQDDFTYKFEEQLSEGVEHIKRCKDRFENSDRTLRDAARFFEEAKDTLVELLNGAIYGYYILDFVYQNFSSLAGDENPKQPNFFSLYNGE